MQNYEIIAFENMYYVDENEYKFIETARAYIDHFKV